MTPIACQITAHRVGYASAIAHTAFSLTNYYNSDSDRVNVPGPFSTPLAWLKSTYRVLYVLNICFPFCVVTWSFLLFWRRTKSHQRTLAMGAIVLLALYGLVITTLGGYTPSDYMRFHIVFDPLLIVVVWGSLLIGVWLIIQRAIRWVCVVANPSNPRAEASSRPY